MKANNLRRKLQTRPAMIVVGAVFWLLLTITLGTLIIYTDRSLEGLIGFHLSAGFAFFGALVIGMLFGATIEHTRVLVAMTVLSSVSAAGMYVALLYTPVLTDVIVATPGLQNFASTRAILYFGLAIIPMALGAVFGQLIGPMIPGGDLLAEPRNRDADDWWLTRRQQPGERPSRHRST